MSDDVDGGGRPHASARPGWVFVAYAFRALAGLALAAPFAFEVGALLGRTPRGDAALYDPGGELLLDLVREAHSAVPGLLAGAGVGLVVAAFLGLLPLAALLVALGYRGELPMRVVLARAAASLGPLSVLLGLALFAQAVLAALAHVALSRVIASLGWPDPPADLARVAAALVVGLGVVSLGVAHDLARVVAVDERRDVYGAVSRALDVLRARPVRVALDYGLRAALAGGALVVATVLAARVGVQTPVRLAVSALVHQVGLGAAVALRASWLAAAMGHTRGAARVP